MTHKRINYATGVAWEPLRGYSRAVCVDNVLYISGTTAIGEDGEVVGPGDAYEQTSYVLRVVRKILRAAGYTLDDVVRTRLFVTDMSQWKKYARAHREMFENIRPASSIVEVSRLMDPRLVLEMEVEAVRGCGAPETRKVE